MKKYLWLAVVLAAALAQAGEDHLVTQKNKAFSVTSLKIKLGDQITFRNDDAFVHNVFSLADDLPFDLGTYPQGQSKSVTFNKAGKFEIECAIHPEMKLSVTVNP